ncbi:MAG: endolytic transglycosylase MltG [Acidobacteria bacterium]|nr:endolytic transglycosylase MltG [Acidobacteriota bacterium]
MKRILIGLAVVLVVGCGAALFGMRWIDSRISSPHAPEAGATRDITIARGMNARSVAAALEQADVLEDGRDLVWWLWWTDLGASIQAGDYRFDEAVSVEDVTRIITEGRVRLFPVTLPEGSNRWQAAIAIASAGFGDEEAALRSFMRVDLIADLDPEGTDLEGYLFPETYLVPSGTTTDQVVDLMVAAFRETWDAGLGARASELGWSVREVVTLASLIEAETPSADERGLVSAVFHNRLERGMLLQTDPTVLYARWLAGKDGRTIYMSDLRRDSPYNTYLYPGLPAGPIGSPRASSLDAALDPAESDFLYFVSRNDGTHAFSTNLRDHNTLVNEYQR